MKETPLTNVQVKKDDGTVYINQATGTLYEDRQNDNNTYVIVREGNRPTPLVKNDTYSISCDQQDFQNLYAYLNFRCAFTGEPADFRLGLTDS